MPSWSQSAFLHTVQILNISTPDRLWAGLIILKDFGVDRVKTFILVCIAGISHEQSERNENSVRFALNENKTKRLDSIVINYSCVFVPLNGFLSFIFASAFRELKSITLLIPRLWSKLSSTDKAIFYTEQCVCELCTERKIVLLGNQRCSGKFFRGGKKNPDFFLYFNPFTYIFTCKRC